MSIESVSSYHRRGRVEGIRRIVDDLMAAHLANPVIRACFENAKGLDRASRSAWPRRTTSSSRSSRTASTRRPATR
jgi:hypothetical protein